MSEMKEYLNVEHDLRNQVKLFIGERSKTPFDSGCKMFDLNLHEPFDFDFITFQNSYTAYLTIKAKEKNSDKANSEWKILLKRYKLMENVHSESNCEARFKITKDMFLEKNLGKISHLRFILQQPSMYWRDFGVDEIRLKIYNPEISFEKVIEEYSKKCENQNNMNFENLPSLDLISTKLQNLWLICCQVGQLKKDPIEDNPRFDVNDGCYDVNLLTYNTI